METLSIKEVLVVSTGARAGSVLQCAGDLELLHIVEIAISAEEAIHDLLDTIALQYSDVSVAKRSERPTPKR